MARMTWDEYRERYNEGPEDFADWPEDTMPENSCDECGADMDDPNIGMYETTDGDYICLACYSAKIDRAVERAKERDL